MYRGYTTPLCTLSEEAASLSAQLRCHPLLSLCFCHLHMADLNLTGVGGQAQGMSTGISQL